MYSGEQIRTFGLNMPRQPRKMGPYFCGQSLCVVFKKAVIKIKSSINIIFALIPYVLYCTSIAIDKLKKKNDLYQHFK